jgi:hypothetical protein
LLCVVVASAMQDEEVVKWSEATLSSGPSSRGSSSRFGVNGSQDLPRSSSFVSSPHRTAGSSHYLAHDDVPETSPSALLRRWRSTSPSTVECLLTLVSTM